MLALAMDKSAVKNFMGKMVREEILDAFEVRTVEISAATHISIEANPPTTWGELRPMIFEILKLSAKPKHMKIVFSRANAETLHTNAAALFLNLVYENDELTFTTASSQKEFALDKSIDIAWDDWIRGFFKDFPISDRL
ncbi:MAG: DUF5721 family protein [Defluviitaleaceae bacterium]|nr:DUF5721 family protein [Defluviitaleaceae bacterium]